METMVRCLRSPRNLFLSSLKTHRVVEPTINSTNIRFRTLKLKPLNVDKMESLENAGLDTKEWEKDKSDATTPGGGDQCPRVSEETATCRQPHSDDGQTFRKIPLLPESSRSEKLRSLPPGLARVPPAHLDGSQSARRGCRGRRGSRGLLQREVSPGLQQLSWRHSAWSDVPLFSGVRETRRTLLATQPSCPPGLEAPQPCQEQGSSRVVRSVPILEFPRHNDTVELCCPLCESLASLQQLPAMETPRNASSTSVITTSWWCGAK